MANHTISTYALMGGGMGIVITWNDRFPLPANTKLIFSGGNPAYSYDCRFTTDPAQDPSLWTIGTPDSITHQLGVSLVKPLYMFPRYSTSLGIWQRYSDIGTTPSGAQANATSNDNSSAGITISIMGGGGGGPEDEA